MLCGLPAYFWRWMFFFFFSTSCLSVTFCNVFAKVIYLDECCSQRPDIQYLIGWQYIFMFPEHWCFLMFLSFVQAAAAAQAGASVIQIFVGRLRVSIPFYWEMPIFSAETLVYCESAFLYLLGLVAEPFWWSWDWSCSEKRRGSWVGTG